jgi:hypothetical protein
MDHWGIYIAYTWTATIVWAVADDVLVIRRIPEPCPQHGTPPVRK